MAGLLAHITAALHIVALLYIGFGGFLAWHWPRSILVHVLFAAWGVAINVFPITCPFTALEDYFRRLQGIGPLPGGFNEYYFYDSLFPREALPGIVLAAFGVLVISYVGAYRSWRQQHPVERADHLVGLS